MKTQKRSRNSAIPLPDDVVMEILSRMPALDVLKCRRVCRRWRDLISTNHFQEMHLKAKAYHSSMILLSGFESIQNKGALLLLDKWEKPRRRPTIRRSRPNFVDNNTGSGLIDVELSYDGLIVMKSSLYVNDLCVFAIFNPLLQNKENPISRDAVKLEIPADFEVYGMFFNASIKEYCMLFLKNGRVESQSIISWSAVEFQVLNLGAQPCCRTLKQSVSFLHKHRTSSGEPPVVIDDDATIYWLVEAVNVSYDYPSCEELIMTFDIKTEVFSFMPHPHPIHNCKGLEHKDMHIMKIDGSLSFVQSTTANESILRIINIWTLKDSATQLWSKTYSVSIDVSLDSNPLWRRCLYFMVLAVRNGEMLLQYSDYDHNRGDGGVCVYNLQMGTLKRIGKAYLKFVPNVSAFVPSFVSLKNCKPIIRI